MDRLRLAGKTIALGLVAAIAYGIVHDQISVRLSPPYLMDWHASLVESRDPTTVALAWGVAATWWFGLILGAVLAFAATIGRRPPAPWRSIVRATARVFVAAALAAAIAYIAARGTGLQLPDSLFGLDYARLPIEERLAFSAVAAMHEASYDVAAVATLVVSVLLWRGRKTVST